MFLSFLTDCVVLPRLFSSQKLASPVALPCISVPIPVSVIPLIASVPVLLIHVISVQLISVPLVSVPVISVVVAIPVSSVPVMFSSPVVVVVPLSIFPNSIGYIVLRIKNVVNPKPTNIIKNKVYSATCTEKGVAR